MAWLVCAELLRAALVWHYGNWPTAFSSLILRYRGAVSPSSCWRTAADWSTFPSIGAGNILGSPFAGAFLSSSAMPMLSQGHDVTVSAASYRPDAASPEAWSQLRPESRYGHGNSHIFAAADGTRGHKRARERCPRAVVFRFTAADQFSDSCSNRHWPCFRLNHRGRRDSLAQQLDCGGNCSSIFTANAQAMARPRRCRGDGMSYSMSAIRTARQSNHDGDFLILFGTGIRGAAEGNSQLTIVARTWPVLYAGRQSDFVDSSGQHAIFRLGCRATCRDAVNQWASRQPRAVGDFTVGPVRARVHPRFEATITKYRRLIPFSLSADRLRG